MKFLESKLEALRTQQHYRELKPLDGLDFSSNDYLGLSQHPAIKQAMQKALNNNIPLGSGGSRLLRGNHPAHVELETFAATFFGTERALFMANGFMANYALLTTLPQRGDTLIFDALCHASMRDGIHASAAKNIKVPHNDLNAFEAALQKASGQKWLCTEAVFSMDGDRAPVSELLALAEKYDATLILDAAHEIPTPAVGTLAVSSECANPLNKTQAPDSLNQFQPARHPRESGALAVSSECANHLNETQAPDALNQTQLTRHPREGGDPVPAVDSECSHSLTNHCHLQHRLITLHTCGKAMGVEGALIYANATVIDYLINCARPFIYSTAPSPLIATAVLAALKVLGDEPERLTKLNDMVTFAHQTLAPIAKTTNHGTPIIPIIIGDNAKTLAIAEHLQSEGFDIRAIRPPTVPEGTSRLRLTVNITQTREDWQKCVAVLADLMENAAA